MVVLPSGVCSHEAWVDANEYNVQVVLQVVGQAALCHLLLTHAIEPKTNIFTVLVQSFEILYHSCYGFGIVFKI